MKKVRYVVFRYLTHTDFFNMYKPPYTEAGGGGQSYVDFGVGSISSEDWQRFFDGVISTMRKQGPSWSFKINSIGLKQSQNITIYQRRPQSFSIAGQKITSSQSKRVYAWHPDNGFPQPKDPTDRHSCPPGLAIYIVRTDGGEFWAGWFRDTPPYKDTRAFDLIKEMLPDSPIQGDNGFIEPNNQLYIDESDLLRPFQTIVPTVIPTKVKKPKEVRPRRTRSEDEITSSLFEEDESDVSESEVRLREVISKVRSRNTRAIRDLKELYQGRCQITGDAYAFTKKDGTFYCEAHHLIPLGNEGADSPYNIIIVNPLIHRMLHYADVLEINLSLITEKNTLDISINGKSYTITWHPEHAGYVRKHQ